MSTDSDATVAEDLRSIQTRYDLPPEMADHLQYIIAQADDESTPAANANKTATRIQQFLTFLMEDYRDEFDEAEDVRDELADIYATIATSESTK